MKNNQVLVARADLYKLVEFQKTISSAFAEMEALFMVITERSDEVSIAHRLADLGATHAGNWQDYCIDDGSLERMEKALDAQYKGESQ